MKSSAHSLTIAFRHVCLIGISSIKAAVASAEIAVKEAQEEASRVLGAEEDDEDGAPTRPPPKSVVSREELFELETAFKKATKAGTLIPQVTR